MPGDDVPYDTKLITWEKLPQWMKDNEYILTAYRKATKSYASSFRSSTHVHNETVNIWTHLLGAALFAYKLYIFNTSYHLIPLPLGDRIAVSIYYFGVINCFTLSTSYHIFSNHSKEVHKFGNELDHIGVVLVIYGSTLPATYFEFYHQSALQYLYWTVSTLFAAASAVFTLRPKFRTPAYRRARFYMYTLLGLSVFFPVIHGILLDGYVRISRRMNLEYLIRLGILNFSGAAIYAARIPERWSPRTFDVVGASHQLMHVLVVLGALKWETGLLRCVKYYEAGRLALRDDYHQHRLGI